MSTSSPRVLFVVFTALTLTLSGCGFTGDPASSETGSGIPDTDQRVVVDNFRAPAANWAMESDDAYILSLAGCLETLTSFDQDKGEVLPSLATEWEQSTPVDWDFSIRDGVTFQDGSELDAEAVVSALNHVLDAEVPARTFNRTMISEVTAIDDRTVRVSTPEENSLVPYRLASVNTGILSSAAYAEEGVDPFGHCTGPFTPVSEKVKQSLTLDRHEDYWGGDVQLAGAEIRFITNGATRATQVQTGEADISLSVPVASLAALEADSDVRVLSADSPRTSTLYMNNDRAPLDDVQVRKAIRSALDLEALAASVYEGAALPAEGPFAPSEPWAGGTERPIQDLDEARELLAEAGYTPERPLEVIAIVERTEFADVAAVVQENLEEIGIPVTIESKEYASAEPDVLDGNYDMLLSQRNRLIDIADPIGFLNADYTCDGAYNLSHFCDPAFDRILAEAVTTEDASERYGLYAQAGQTLDDQAVNAWLVNEQAIDAVSDDVLFYEQDPLSRYVLTAETAKAGS